MIVFGLQLAGVACLVMSPLLFISSFVVLGRLGNVISRKHRSVWEEMKPGMYSDIGVSREHRRRLGEFLSTREYLEFNDPTISRLAVIYRAINIATAVALIAGAGLVAWSFLSNG